MLSTRVWMVMQGRTVSWAPVAVGALLGLIAFGLLVLALDPGSICQTSLPPNCTVRSGIPGLTWQTQNGELATTGFQWGLVAVAITMMIVGMAAGGILQRSRTRELESRRARQR